MFGSKVLEVAAGLSFVYLLLSLICSSMTEFISRLFQWRHEMLEDGIRAMLSDLNHPAPAVAPGVTAVTALATADTALASANAAFQTASAALDLAQLNLAAAPSAAERAAAFGAVATAESAVAAKKLELGKARVDRDLLIKLSEKTAAANQQVTDATITVAALRSVWTWIQRRVAKTVLERKTARQTALAHQISTFQELLESPLITSLAGKGKVWLGKQDQRPSYIPSRTFSLALFNLFAPTDPNQPTTIGSIRDSVAHMQPSETQRALLAMIDGSKNDLEVARQKVEQWFDDTMEQASAWYQRKANTILFLIAGVVCIALNVDSIAIGSALWHDDKLRDVVFKAAQAEVQHDVKTAEAEAATAKANAIAKEKTADIAKAAEIANANPEEKATVAKKVATDAESAAKTANEAAESATKRVEQKQEELTPKKEFEKTLKAVSTRQSQLISLEIPMGWSKEKVELFFSASVRPLETVVGWIVTIVAVSLGAPFWFDALNKLVNFRAAANKPETSASNKPPNASK
ncbi:MAG: hypothetical protein ACKV2Q_05410 [Planctomycetaceae bacterium]